MSATPSDSEEIETMAKDEADPPQPDDAGDPPAQAAAGQGGSEPKAVTLEGLLEGGEVHPVVVKALAAAEAKAKEAEDRMLRAVAETQNERRRLAKDQQDRIRFANESLLSEMLPVLDNLELCLAHAGDDTDVKNLWTGVEMTLTQFKQAIESVGAEPIQVSVGDAFDPKLHDAVLQDDEADLPARTIAKVMQSGFTYRERVLRPAKVVVATGKGLKN